MIEVTTVLYSVQEWLAIVADGHVIDMAINFGFETRSRFSTPQGLYSCHRIDNHLPGRPGNGYRPVSITRVLDLRRPNAKNE